ncbi:DUF6193 family natural product biosynthesis protein [Streptomyces xantholiticus]|uniref:DUF6193 family natural product biosynthesis protein n=1 Tax=Streptomyces xantholiticus TaxID=68285 RepID=UPI001E629628|nr:DUF6193 family natural product biosynthesis protein [Streptomyces xantholiticus]
METVDPAGPPHHVRAAAAAAAAAGSHKLSARGIGGLGEVHTVEEAFALVVANLPKGCGPAVNGTADDVPS